MGDWRLGEHRLCEKSPCGKTHVWDLPISYRAYNCLVRSHILTVDDLLCYADADLLQIKNFGKVSLSDVRAALEDYGKKREQESAAATL